MSIWSGVAGVVLGGVVWAQNAPPQPAPPLINAQNVPPAVKLGARVQAVRRVAEVASTVVIVPDAPSYLAAVSAWTPTRRFPVLIDDGVFETRELISCFVRGFEPKTVVGWSAGTSPVSVDTASFGTVTADQLGAAVARGWGLKDQDATTPNLIELWKFNKYAPPGLVVTNEKDPAWPAAVALASARGQILMFVEAKQGVDTLMSPAEADALERAIEASANASGLAWRETGDDLEAITLCLNTPNRLDAGKGEFFAVTDRIGRHGEGLNAEARWAWCGQIFGSPAQAAYRAMCSLFLQPTNAWMFDGYPTSDPWNQYDCTKAAEFARQANLTVEIFDTPRQGAADWRTRAARPVDAGLILVNTSGNDDFFNLQPDKARPGDVPFLLRPAIAHVVHSWSATNIGNRDRLAGRWLERGVFCYAGSVHEPYLQAFVPTPAVVGRLLSGAPFAPSVRAEGKLWKITVVGDPLYTVGPGATRADAGCGLENAADIQSDLRAYLTGKQYAQAFTVMTLCGRDAEIAKLASALLSSSPGDMTPDAAELVVTPLFRAGNTELVWKAFARLDERRRKHPVLRDALWLSAGPLLGGKAPDELLATLRDNPRQDLAVRDLMMLARAWADRHGMDKAQSMLREARARLNAAQQKDLDGWMKERPEKWGT